MGWFNWNHIRDAALAPITAPIKTTQALMHGQMPTAQSLASGDLLGGDKTMKASPTNLLSGGLLGGFAGGKSPMSPMPPSGTAQGGGLPAPPSSGGGPDGAPPPPAASPPTPAPFAPLEPAGGFMSSGRAFNPQMWHGSGMPNPQSMGSGGLDVQSLIHGNFQGQPNSPAPPPAAPAGPTPGAPGPGGFTSPFSAASK